MDTPTNRVRSLGLALTLIALALAVGGNQEPSCQPVEPDAPVCLTAVDCDGLVPVINCVGAWTCVEAACAWECATPGCSENADCAEIVTTLGITPPPEYCAKAAGDCDGTGECAPVPEICTKEYAPVCGCDGVTYGNGCMASAAAANVAASGECAIEPAGCKDNADCPADASTNQDRFCAKAAGDCEGYGACLPRPDMCTQQYAPVCGCDGKTHGNACGAAGAGVSVKYDGACP